jgi:hypothetical protein
LDKVTKGQLFSAIAPSENRRYYKIDEISLQETERLSGIYRSLIKAKSGDQTIILAVTDTKVNETYLLPGFFKLKEDNERAQNLFHEAMWIFGNNFFSFCSFDRSASGNHLGSLVGPSDIQCNGTPYEAVVNAELAYAGFLTVINAQKDSYPLALYEKMSRVYGFANFVYYSAINYDLRQGNLPLRECSIVPDSGGTNDAKCVDLYDMNLVGSGAQFLASSLSQKSPNVALYKVLAWNPDFPGYRIVPIDSNTQQVFVGEYSVDGPVPGTVASTPYVILKNEK